MNLNLSDIANSKDAIAKGLPVFSILSDGAIKAFKSKDATDDKLRVTLTASTSATDLEGDVFTKSALEQMKSAAPGTSMFLNHKFIVPDDVFGMVESADLVTRDAANGGGKILCLEYVATVEQDNPRALQTYKQIANGQKLGCSVTALITKALPGKDGKRLIDSVYYLECSIVGLPMNQESWVQRAQKSLAKVSDDDFQELAGIPKAEPLSLSLAPRATPWNRVEAEKRVKEWAGADADKAASCRIGDDLIADVIEKEARIVPKAVFSLASRKANDPQIETVYAFMSQEFKDASIVPPWKKEDGLAKTILSALVAKAPKTPDLVKMLTDISSEAGITIVQANDILNGNLETFSEKAMTAFGKALEIPDTIEMLALEAGLFGEAPRFFQKGMFQRELKERISSIWFLTGILQDVLWNLMYTARWGEGAGVDFAFEAATICDEFKGEIMARLVPAMIAAAAELPDADYTLLMESFLNFDPASVWQLVNEQAEKALDPVSKAGARNSKKDATRIQTIHDYSVELDAKCVAAKGVDDVAATALLGVKVAALKEQYDTDKAEMERKIAALEGDKASQAELIKSWETTAGLMKKTIDALANQPLPRGGI